jgi:predicted MPP superfamily phosphohydrolase
MFGSFLLFAGSVMQFYVFWRAVSVPIIARHVSRKILFGAGIILWMVFLLTQLFEHSFSSGVWQGRLQVFGMDWLATMFLASLCLFVVDLVIGFGFFLPRFSPTLRGCALILAGVLSAIAVYQGTRAPVVRSYDVRLAGFPSERDGMVLVAVSDFHLGAELDGDWLAARVAQVQAEKPDLIVLLGDLFEGHGRPSSELFPILRRLSAPLGVWAVNGNHESHGRSSSNTSVLEEAGFRLLHNRSEQVCPGLVIAGVDDLTSRRRSGGQGDLLRQALVGRPAGATIFLSHTPWQAEEAANDGVGLMLSAHTHGGQIWPFGYLVQIRYPLLAGRYDVNGMPVIVSRGTGTWGPRMRLWQPGEILRITLHSK